MMRTVALILVENDDFKQAGRAEGQTPVRLLIRTFSQVGVDGIVLSSQQSVLDSLKKFTAHMDVLYVAEDGERAPGEASQLSLALAGLRYLHGRYDRILLASTEFPYFRAETASALLGANAPLILPVHDGREGYPMVLSNDRIPLFLRSEGRKGVREAAISCGCERLPVDDVGVVLPSEAREEGLASLQRAMFAEVRVRLVRKRPFFGQGSSRLLILIDETGSVRLACELMGMSYSKGWKIIRDMEDELGRPMVLRRQGGKYGGNSSLTPEGREFLDAYGRFEKISKRRAQEAFRECFAHFLSALPDEGKE